MLAYAGPLDRRSRHRHQGRLPGLLQMEDHMTKCPTCGDEVDVLYSLDIDLPSFCRICKMVLFLRETLKEPNGKCRYSDKDLRAIAKRMAEDEPGINTSAPSP